MSKVFDCIVLGVGGMGSAALLYAAKKSWRTIGIDRFEPGHARGSSHGRTRIIRQAYFEHPDYVPLLLDSYQLWEEIQSASGQHLFEETGLLQVGDPQGDVISGIRRSADEHSLDLVELKTNELRQHYPLFNFRDGDVGLFEKAAGFLRVEKSVCAFVEAAKQQGAELQTSTVVKRWSEGAAGFEVEIEDANGQNAETIRGLRLIVTAGAWASALLGDSMPGVASKLQVVAKHQHWFKINDDRIRLEAGCPTFFFETGDGCFYGFPDCDGHGAKIAEHTGGVSVEDPLTVNRELDTQDLQRVQQFSQVCFNAPRGIHIGHSVCMYTMSPDEHFIVDRIGENVSFACGMSGHGFKFAPVIGRALVDMLDGNLRADMQFLKASRFDAKES